VGSKSTFILKKGRKMIKKAEKVKMIIFDIDGTLTDGSIIIDSKGNESKKFNVKDGFAIAQAVLNGIICVIITGRESEVVKIRAKELKIEEIYQGIKDKSVKIREVVKKYNIKLEETAYFGDDINDLPAFLIAGFKGCTADGVEELKEKADFISKRNGGDGAAREFVEFILREKGIWKKIVEKYSIKTDE
jgi:3-deoxy-D-manno-octulosonate 8-phosphate phosphatase (KDO 8-P phosphatase)